MKTIHKHRLEIDNQIQEIKLAKDARLLRVDFVVQDNAIQMWAEVDAETVIDTPKDLRRFKVFLTGTGIPDNALYVGSTFNHLKPDAYHVYELVD